MKMQQALDTVGVFLEQILGGPRVTGTAVVVVVSAIWAAFTSVLAVVLALLFLTDLVLGSLRAVHRGGIRAFEWPRFWRAWVKMGAALVGIALFSAGDVLLHETGVMPDDWSPLATVALSAMCWGFFASALTSFGYFFPDASELVERALSRMGSKQPNFDRREGDPAPPPPPELKP